MSAYDQAAVMAAATGRPHYVNRCEQFLLAEPYRDRLCCAVVHPDGRLERVVQGYSHAVAVTAALNT